MTFEELGKLHKELWGWLAETGTKEKSGWPEWKSNGGPVEDVSFHCFCCNYVEHSYEPGRQRDMCGYCPVVWVDGSPSGGVCSEGKSPYIRWNGAETPKTRKKYAAIIRDLPWERKV